MGITWNITCTTPGTEDRTETLCEGKQTSFDQPSPQKALLPRKSRSISCLQPTCSIYYSFLLSLCYPFIENGHILSKCRFADIIDIFLENGYWTAQGFQIERDLRRHLKANLRGEEAP